jgi:tetratricopeptide (TPR) repeat protein
MNISGLAGPRPLDSSRRFCFAVPGAFRHNEQTLKAVTITFNDLFEFDGQPVPAQRPDASAIEAIARRQFAFLRQPLQIDVGENAVTISFNLEATAAQDEAIRLAERAKKRADEGSYDKAISLYKRVLELNPSHPKARRDLAMACMESGDIEGAKNHLIEVLRLNPGDAWGWVVLGNLYARNQKDWDTAEKFLRRAVEISPDDPWALNGMAAISAQRGKTDEALQLFERAIAANPNLPNTYYGLGVTYHRANKPDLAVRALDRLFATARAEDVRAKYVFDQSRALYGTVQDELMQAQHPEAFKAVENFRAGLELASGYPVKLIDGDFRDKTSATIQMAWKHGRDHHVIKFRTGLDEVLRTHQMAHELSHLQLEAEARKAGKNYSIISTDKTEQAVLKRLESDIQRIERKGYPAQAAHDLVTALIRGLTSFLYNCPLDMLIETRLRERMPGLSAVQFVALRMGAREALESQSNPKILEVTPKLILRAGTALNGAYSLFLDHLYHGATDYAQAYQRSESFTMSQRLFRHWQARFPRLGPGDEYTLVDEFADMVGLRGWYEWKPDTGANAKPDPSKQEGTSNPDLLRMKTTPAVYYCLDALKRYDTLPVEKIREITLEIGMVGRAGLDYASPDRKYLLKALPDEKFSGLHLMCLMFAGFKRIAPEHDLHMDLHEPFLTALEMFQKGEPGLEV